MKKNEVKFICILIVFTILFYIFSSYFRVNIYDFSTKIQTFFSSRNGQIDINSNLQSNEMLLGLYDVTGEGIVIDINDGKDLIHQEDVIIMLDELKNAGAEAICVNNIRITSKSYLYCDGSVILLDGVKIGNPFCIKAIGNSEVLYGAICRNKGYINTLRDDGISIDVNTNENITMSKTNLEIIKDYDKYSTLDKYILSNKYVGKSNFYGSGLNIVIEPPKDSDLTAVTLLQLINDLNSAGANAININNQRIVCMSDIMDINSEYVLVNSIPISAPYTVNVIGNTSKLLEGLSLENSTISKLYNRNYNIEINSCNFINLQKYSKGRAQDKLIYNYMNIPEI